MGGLRKWSPPKDEILDGGLEWNCSQLHLQLERGLCSLLDADPQACCLNVLSRFVHEFARDYGCRCSWSRLVLSGLLLIFHNG
jgi:hypothetical protein